MDLLVGHSNSGTNSFRLLGSFTMELEDADRTLGFKPAETCTICLIALRP